VSGVFLLIAARRRIGCDPARRLRHKDGAAAVNFNELRGAGGPGDWPNGLVAGGGTLRYPDSSIPPAEDLMSKPKPSAQRPAEADEDRLDEALEETFPASDPIAIEPDDDANDRADDSSHHAPAREKKRH
jgi:hypothetical protein